MGLDSSQVSKPGKCFLAVQPGSLEPRLLALGNVEACLAQEGEAGLAGERGRLPSQGWQKGRERRGFSRVLSPEKQTRTQRRIRTHSQSGCLGLPGSQIMTSELFFNLSQARSDTGQGGELSILREKGPSWPPLSERCITCHQWGFLTVHRDKGVQRPLEVTQEGKCNHYLSPVFLLSPLPYHRPVKVRWVTGKGTGVGEGGLRNLLLPPWSGPCPHLESH